MSIPLKDAIWYGKEWTYDECLANIEEPSLTNSGLSELELRSTRSYGPGARDIELLMTRTMGGSHRPTSVQVQRRAFGPSYKYYASMMGTVRRYVRHLFSKSANQFYQPHQWNSSWLR